MNMLEPRTDLRNIAIIAHVDHGKTTLVDGLLRQARVFRENQTVIERVMDSNDLERERGITILAKNTAIHIWDAKAEQEVKINIVDTPGHADFGGEVERVLNMVDGVLLLVDAAEGPMPQTRFVLKKALALNHRALVVINKVDRKGADPVRCLNQTFDLFVELGASDEQADFPVVYTNAVTGQAGLTPELGPDLGPLFESILRNVPPPNVDRLAPLQMLVTNLGYDDYRGVTAVGRISAGELHAGQAVARLKLDGTRVDEQARYLYVHDGLERKEVDAAQAGEIVVIAGLEEVAIGETLADPDQPVALPAIRVEEPTVRMTFGVNTSPMAGREGRWGTSRKLRDRLFDELRHNVALRVEDGRIGGDLSCFRARRAAPGDIDRNHAPRRLRISGFSSSGHPEGERRRWRSWSRSKKCISKPRADTMGTVVEMLGARRGQMVDMTDMGDEGVRLTFIVPTRGLMGFRQQFLTSTRGEGVMHALFHGYLPYAGAIEFPHYWIAGRLGARYHHHLRLEERRGKGRAVRRPGHGGLRGHGGR